MKKLLLSLFLFNMVLFASAQTAGTLPVDPETKKITYSEVVQADGATKDDLYLKAKNWALSNGYKTKVDSKEEGKIVTTGQYAVQYPSPVRGMNHQGLVKFNLTISTKEGKYKYEITDLVHESRKGNGGKLESDMPACGKYTLTIDGWKTIKVRSGEEIPKIVSGLKSNLAAAPAPVKKSEDW